MSGVGFGRKATPTGTAATNAKTKSNNAINNKKGKKWIVALMDKESYTSVAEASAANNTKKHLSTSTTSTSSSPPLRMVNLKDPATGDLRNYVVAQNQQPQSSSSTTTVVDIMEIQSLQSDFSSFFVGRHVISDGNLYVLNRMDPLFWVVASQETTAIETSTGTETTAGTTKKRSWQPYHQVVGSLFETTSKNNTKSKNSGGSGSTGILPSQVIVAEQLRHMFDTLCNEQTNDVTYYKFNQSKCLRWLERKRLIVYQCLLLQKKQQVQLKKKNQSKLEQQMKNSNSSGAGAGGSGSGAQSSTFFMPDEDEEDCNNDKTDETRMSDANSDDDDGISTADYKQMKLESVQIICNYLTAEWCNTFMKSLPSDVASTVVAPVESTTTKSTTNTYSKNNGRNTSSSSVPTVTQDSSSGSDDDEARNKKRKTTQVDDDENTSSASHGWMTSKKKVPPPPPKPRSSLNKSLDKVNKKGMKKLSSFFGAPQSKKPKTNSLPKPSKVT